jgi:hypothetical protein
MTVDARRVPSSAEGWWPDVAIVAFVFLLYTNIPTLLRQAYQLPTTIAGAYILLLIPPLLHSLSRGHRLRVDAVSLLMLLFLAVLLASSLQARLMSVVWMRLGTYLVEGILLYWLVVNVITRITTIRRVIWTVLVAGALLGALSAWQAATGSLYEFGGLSARDMEMVERAEHDRIVLGRPLESYRGADRAEGPVDEPNRYAQLMIVLLPLALLQIRSALPLAKRAAAAGLGLLVLAGVLLSYSRGGAVALVLLAPALTAVGWLRPTRLVFGTVALATVIAIAAPGYYQRVASIASAASMFTGGGGVQADGAIRGRTTEMLAALHAALDHPVLGLGPGQYWKVYSIEYHQLPGIQFREIRETRRAHSLYLEMAADTGAIGLVTFLAIVGVSMAALWRARRRWAIQRPDLSALATALWLSTLLYLVTGTFLHLAFERYFWFLLALTSATVQAMDSEARAPLPAT